MAYAVKEIYATLQGEGIQSGRVAVFLRFTGCNLWSGHEADRAKALCQFCDTDFVGTDGPGGGRFETPQALAEAVAAKWPAVLNASTTPKTNRPNKLVVCTGGEPLLQLDEAAIDALHELGFEVAVETNGTQTAPAGIDWLTVSPKAGSKTVQKTGDELKLVFRQDTLGPEDVADWAFDHFLLQPMDGPDVAKHTAAAIEYCLADPQWRLSVQTHKTLGLA